MMPEACVEQVEYRMLCATDVKIWIAPIFFLFGIDQGSVIIRVDVAQVIPARAGPLRHGVGLSGGIDPTFDWFAGGGASCWIEINVQPCVGFGERTLAIGRGGVALDFRKCEW